MTTYDEAAFESVIENHLIENGGFRRGDPTKFDPEFALIPEDLFSFIQETQEDTWKKQRKIHGDNLEKNLLAALDKESSQRGILHVLRHGFKFYGKLIRIAAFKPATTLNPETERKYNANRLTVIRQLHHNPKRPKKSLDLVLFLNGIPIITAELKNPMTGQKVTQAKKQYQRRDPKTPIFRFKRRALVHFAVDPDEVEMTTRIDGINTRFLPFNRGEGTAAGNPAVEGKHKTFYLWEEVWARDSLLDIIARFIHLQVDEKTTAAGKKIRKEVMIFPRYHQLDVVRKLVAAAKTNGAGTNYLVQHSAGSGKSNSIAWLAHRLSSLHDVQDQKVYQSVVVITDRIVLDRQLQDTIYQFEHKRGVVHKIDKHSTQLAAALETCVPIIISTIHKFGFIQDKIQSLPDRRYAIIVDEAHSSQTGEMAVKMKEILSDSSIATKLEDEGEDLSAPDQAALRAALFRGPQHNMSFFAFTATPKFKTLELFGHKGEDGNPTTFHLYSMRQAIEEGFILDVLLGYTTYSRYFKLQKKVADDPELAKRRTSKDLARYVSLHPTNISQKTEVMIEHFRTCVKSKIGGRAKAMVVTSSRRNAVAYKLAFDKYLKEKGYHDIRCLVAFSGEIRDEIDVELVYTERSMNNGIRETELPQYFATDEYQLLIVADKYQTGFDQPLLHTMYVDKRLSGIRAVQTLSRLNRTYPGKEDTFVLDFVNDPQEILKSFQPYYEGTTITEEVDPQRLYELQGALDDAHVYEKPEVEQFARVFFKPKEAQGIRDNALLNAALDPAVDRFIAKDEAVREEFRNKLSAYCKLYSFLAQVVPFADADLEKLYAFGRMLLKKLPRKGEEPETVNIGDYVALQYYRLEKKFEGDLSLATGDKGEVKGPSETGTAQAKNDKVKLSKLIDLINHRFGTDFDAQDLIDGVTEQLVADETIQQAARVNDEDNFRYIFEPALDNALIDRHAKHKDFIDQVFSDDELLRFFQRHMLNEVYRRLTRQEEASAPV